METVFLFNW